MKRYFLIIALLCGLALVLAMVAGVAARPAAMVPGKEEAKKNEKDGDMHVVWFGHGYRQRSMRLDSVGNRSYRGGGMHGGK